MPGSFLPQTEGEPDMSYGCYLAFSRRATEISHRYPSTYCGYNVFRRMAHSDILSQAYQ